jgi:hypothetical protein
MNRYAAKGVVLALAAVSAGCKDFLQGPGLTESPNSATEATPQQQLIAVQANMNRLLEGQLARQAGIYTQQIIGSNNQQLQWGTQYGVSESDISAFMSGFYTGAGLVGLRNIQAYGATNDKLLEGVAKVWEGLAFGTATSIWGDLPYSEAVDPDIVTPRLDAQQSIYTEVQARLDEGIAALQAAPSTGTCEIYDLIYCGSAPLPTRAQQIGRWIAAARTLKARFHLHLVERQGNAAYTAALAQAQQGISEAPTSATQAIHGQGPGDFRTFHGTTLDQDANIWYEFLNQRQDLVAGNALVQALKARSDPRLQAYFNANASGEYTGADANNNVVGVAPASTINTPVRRAPAFRQPIVTWAENQLILAEANFVLNGPAAALPFVNAVRTAVGLPLLVAVTFNDVMIEKYIAMYQNIDAWSDYKRTCLPTLSRYASATEIPGRLPYGTAERTANPNIPLASAYPTGTTGPSALRNWNDPAACP